MQAFASLVGTRRSAPNVVGLDLIGVFGAADRQHLWDADAVGREGLSGDAARQLRGGDNVPHGSAPAGYHRLCPK